MWYAVGKCFFKESKKAEQHWGSLEGSKHEEQDE